MHGGGTLDKESHKLRLVGGCGRCDANNKESPLARAPVFARASNVSRRLGQVAPVLERTKDGHTDDAPEEDGNIEEHIRSPFKKRGADRALGCIKDEVSKRMGAVSSKSRVPQYKNKGMIAHISSFCRTRLSKCRRSEPRSIDRGATSVPRSRQPLFASDRRCSINGPIIFS